MSHIQQITLDLIPNGEMPILYASQYDAGRSFRANIVERKIPYTLDGTELISLTVRKGDGNLVTMDIANTFAGKTYIDFLSPEQMTAVSGSNFGELHLESNGESIGTLNFYLLVEPAADEGGITSESEINNLRRQVNEMVDDEMGDYLLKTEAEETYATITALETLSGVVDTKASASDLETLAGAVDTKASKTYVDTELNKKADTSSLATVATSGSYNDLTDKPTIPEQVQSDWNEADNTKANYIKNKPNLSTVATSGSYNDLLDRPSIPAAQVNSDWNANSGISQILNKPTLATVATTGDYNDLNNKPSVAVIDDTQASASKVYSSNKVDSLVNNVQSELNDVNTYTQLLNDAIFEMPSMTWEIGSIRSNGVDDDITTAIRTSNYFNAVTNGLEKIKLSADNPDLQFVVAYYTYNAEHDFYNCQGRTSWGRDDFSVNPNYPFVRIAVRYSDQRTISNTNDKKNVLYFGDFSEKYDDRLDSVENEIGSIEGEISDIKHIVEPINVFDKNDADCLTDKYISSANGSEVTLEGSFVSGFIPIKSGDVVTTLNYAYVGTSQVFSVYNSNKIWVSNIEATISDSKASCTIPSGIAFVRVCMPSNRIDSQMVVINSEYPDTYQPYFDAYEEFGNIRLNSSQIAQAGNTNPLEGKSVSFIGDSICYGAGFLGGYGKIIADRNNMTYENIAVSGATISDTTSIDPNNMCIANNVVNMSNSDYIIIEGGCNDAGYQVTLGNYVQARVHPSSPTTFYTWLDKLFGLALATYSGKKIGFIIVHAMLYRFSASDEGAYYNAIVRSCKKWGIPYCDLNTECPPFGLFSDEGDADLKALRTTYTKNGDGWHPNEQGYKKYYCDKIEAFMKSL